MTKAKAAALAESNEEAVELRSRRFCGWQRNTQRLFFVGPSGERFRKKSEGLKLLEKSRQTCAKSLLADEKSRIRRQSAIEEQVLAEANRVADRVVKNLGPAAPAAEGNIINAPNGGHGGKPEREPVPYDEFLQGGKKPEKKPEKKLAVQPKKNVNDMKSMFEPKKPEQPKKKGKK